MDDSDRQQAFETTPGPHLDGAALVVYRELRALAGSYFRSQRTDHTLQPTALVNEAYVKLAGNPDLRWTDRSHFFAIAAKAMREILADHARAHRAQKRGGGGHRTSIPGLSDPGTAPIDALDLHAALDALAAVSPRQAEIVELRYYGGLTVDQVASVLSLSPRTVELDSRMARAWLRRHLDEAV